MWHLIQGSHPMNRPYLLHWHWVIDDFLPRSEKKNCVSFQPVESNLKFLLVGHWLMLIKAVHRAITPLVLRISWLKNHVSGICMIQRLDFCGRRSEKNCHPVVKNSIGIPSCYALVESHHEHRDQRVSPKLQANLVFTRSKHSVPYILCWILPLFDLASRPFVIDLPRSVN